MRGFLLFWDKSVAKEKRARCLEVWRSDFPNRVSYPGALAEKSRENGCILPDGPYLD